MTETSSQCPRIEALSALIDDELDGAPRIEIRQHAASCAMCGATLREFASLKSTFSALEEAPACPDIASLIEPRLVQQPPRPARPRNLRVSPWRLAPAGLAAAGVLASGAYLGMLLAGGTAVGAARPAVIAVFDAVPPGALCAGAGCYARGR